MNGKWYSHQGGYPDHLPYNLFIPGFGYLQWDEATPADIAAAGYVEVVAPPSYDPLRKYLGWEGDEWQILDLEKPEPIVYWHQFEWIANETAKEKNYTSSMDIATYVSSTVPKYAAEAAAFVAWRDSRRLLVEEWIGDGYPEMSPWVDETHALLRTMVWPQWPPEEPQE